jgi:hypothetical protein
MLLVAQKHSGKTFLLAKLIKNYQKTKIIDNEGNIHKVRVILFAPTAFSESNKIYETSISFYHGNFEHCTFLCSNRDPKHSSI